MTPQGIYTDAAQSAGYGFFDAAELGVDLASLSAHKLYGPKGIGALYIRRGTFLTAQQTGGGQERGLRAGTLNVPAIAGLGAAAHLITSDTAPALAQIRALCDRLLDAIPGATVNGHPTRRIPGSLSLTLPDAEAADLLDHLPDIAAAGSACNTGIGEPSHVLTAIGLTRTQARRTLRLGTGRNTTADEVERAAALIAQAAARQRSPRSSAV
ncbi:cysteine desulfurase family protein [Streptomyces sp. NRRL S-237]|uniref:cysteine desulfurase family protein n=1 Tax=Streptomyces sp. NRRL S-237 TaxID=1463895 RepID=UPI000B1A8D93|nr:aminotransferase class V-fold PLP-dependent enzyme [Streptomyces sp. NRRL S-237]